MPLDWKGVMEVGVFILFRESLFCPFGCLMLSSFLIDGVVMTSFFIAVVVMIHSCFLLLC